MLKKTLIASGFNKRFCLHLCDRGPWLQRLGSCSTAVLMRNLILKTTVAGSGLNLSLRVDLERRLVKTENNKTCNVSLFFDIVHKSR